MRNTHLGLVVVIVLLLAGGAFAQPLANPLLAGYIPVVPETALEHNGIPSGGNWELDCDAFGDGTLVAAGIREALDVPGGTPVGSSEREYVALFTTSNTVVITDGFFTETPVAPWETNNDTVRITGNAARIACDKRPGGTRYMLANECSPFSFPGQFPSFSPGMLYGAEQACVQLMNKTGGVPTPVALLEDPAYKAGDIGPSNGSRRIGGDVIGLSNGGFVATVESRDTSTSPTIVGGGDTTPARWEPMMIYDTDGNRVLPAPINANHINPASYTQGWSNVAAWSGGFANYLSSGHNIPGGTYTMQFWLNDGTPDGYWERALRTNAGDPLPPANGRSTSVEPMGSNACNAVSHIQSDYMYLAGRGVGLGGANTGVYITKIDANTKLTVKEVHVNDTFASNVSRTMAGVDENDNVVVVYSTEGGADNNQMICRFYDDNLDPISDAFYCFTNANQPSFTSRRPGCALASDGRALFTGRFEGAGAISIPAYATSLDDDQIAIVLQFPPPPPAGVDNWKLLD